MIYKHFHTFQLEGVGYNFIVHKYSKIHILQTNSKVTETLASHS